MRRDINVVLYGLGSVNKLAARSLVKRGGVRIVGALVRSRGVGEDLGKVIGLGRNLGITVSNDPEEIFCEAQVDVCLHATDSFTAKVYDQVAIPLKHKVNVITACEEIAEPYLKSPYIAAKIDKLARNNGVSIVGTGRAPGFATDALLIYLTSICSEVRSIKSQRTSSLREYRQTSPETFERMQEAFGVGLSPEEYKRKVSKGEIVGHVGGSESISKLAHALGWKLDEINHELEPVIKDGTTAGSRVISRGIMAGQEVLREECDISLHDTLEEEMGTKAHFEIDGVPPIKLSWEPYGVGPIATASLMINQIPAIIKAAPGLVRTEQLGVTQFLEDLGGIEE
jgi:hypothetical protein